MGIFVAIFLGALHVGCTVFQKSADRGGDPVYSVLAEALLWFAFLILFVLAWKFYCAQWRRLSDRSILRIVTEKLWVPFIAVFLITEPRYYLAGKIELEVVATGVALLIALVDWDQSIRRAAESVFAGNYFADRRFLYSQYPPQKRGDLLPMDILINIATFAIIIKKIT